MSFSFLRRTTSGQGVACACPDVETSSPSKPSLLRLLAALVSTLALTCEIQANAKLSWSDNSDNETGFSIERSTGNGDFIEIATVGTNKETYEDTKVQVGEQYSYRVRAFNDYGYSGYTNVSTFDATESDSGGEISPADPTEGSDPGFPSSLIGNHSEEGGRIYIEDTGLHILSGSGKGLRGKWDSLRYAYSTAENNASITLHVPAISTAGSQAEASLLFRQNLKSNSRYVAVSLDQDFNASGSWRTKAGTSVGRTRAAESVPAQYLRINNDGTTHTLEASPDGFSWDTLSVKNCYLKSPYLVGFGISSTDNDNLSYGAFEILESNVPLLPPSYSKFGPHPEFVTASNKSIAATYHLDSDIRLHTVMTKGKGFEQFQDQLAFPSWKNEGRVRIAARVQAFHPDGDWARFGIMLRSGKGSKNAFVAMTVNGKGQFEALWRNKNGERLSTSRNGNAGSAPYLAIEYDGKTASLQYSRDGANWTTFHTRKIQFDDTYRVGSVIGSQDGFSIGAIEIIGLY